MTLHQPSIERGKAGECVYPVLDRAMVVTASSPFGVIISMNKIQGLCRAGALASIAISAIFGATLASAHAKLTSTTPVADSTVSSPKLIQVHFNEAVEVKMSSLKLATSDGTAVGAMAMNDAKDPATLSIMPTTPLKAGAYKVTWSAVTDDGHKVQGSFSFTVQ
jgi:methionine-rich copper-binding protein CopC